jgi:hypothetical protein
MRLLSYWFRRYIVWNIVGCLLFGGLPAFLPIFAGDDIASSVDLEGIDLGACSTSNPATGAPGCLDKGLKDVTQKLKRQLQQAEKLRRDEARAARN